MATLTKDPITGTFYSNGDPTGTGRTMVDLNGGTNSLSDGVATTAASSAPGQPGSDPYTIFNKNVASILKQIQGAQVSGNQKLGAAKDALTTASVTSAPYDATMTPSSNIGIIGGMPGAFAPAVTSIATQEQNTGAALGNLTASLGTMSDIFKPVSVAPGQSLVTPQGQTVLKTPNYQPPTIRPDTLQLDSWDAANAMWKSDEEKSGGTGLPGAQPPNPAVIAGVDVSKYNGNGDPQYGAKVQGIYNTLNSIYPTPTADTLDAYIAGHAKSSPITGQMIMQAATHFGLDPNLLTAQLALESNFGTVGESPANNNPGGVMWINQPNATQGSPRPSNEGGFYAKFKSPLDGLYAMAEITSRGKDSGSSSTNSSSAPTQTLTKDPKGNVYSPASQARVSQLPATVQRYALAGPGGVVYIDGDNASTLGADAMKGITAMAQKAGIPVFSGADISALKGINDLTQQMQTMQQLVDQNLGSSNDNSTLSHGLNAFTSGLNQISQNKPALATFQSYIGAVTTAASNLKALAGGAGSGLRITGVEIAGTADSLPTQTDSWQTAKAKIDAVNLKIAQSMHSLFPDVDPNYAVLPQSQSPGTFNYGSAGSGGTVTMTGPKGTYTVPASQVSTMQQNGYTIQQ